MTPKILLFAEPRGGNDGNALVILIYHKPQPLFQSYN